MNKYLYQKYDNIPTGSTLGLNNCTAFILNYNNDLNKYYENEKKKWKKPRYNFKEILKNSKNDNYIKNNYYENENYYLKKDNKLPKIKNITNNLRNIKKNSIVSKSIPIKLSKKEDDIKSIINNTYLNNKSIKSKKEKISFKQYENINGFDFKNKRKLDNKEVECLKKKYWDIYHLKNNEYQKFTHKKVISMRTRQFINDLENERNRSNIK